MKLVETGELCPSCKRRNSVAVFTDWPKHDPRSNTDTYLACEMCDWRDDIPPPLHKDKVYQRLFPKEWAEEVQRKSDKDG